MHKLRKIFYSFSYKSDSWGYMQY